jgi:hypothetical protein
MKINSIEGLSHIYLSRTPILLDREREDFISFIDGLGFRWQYSKKSFNEFVHYYPFYIYLNLESVDMSFSTKIYPSILPLKVDELMEKINFGILPPLLRD